MEASNKTIDYLDFTTNTQVKVSVIRHHDPSTTASFCFENNRWDVVDILKPHAARGLSRLNFSAVAPWVREDAKRYMAHLWLKTETTVRFLQEHLQSLRELGRFLPDYSGHPIDLRIKHAREFARNYGERDIHSANFRRARRVLNRFISFVQELHPKSVGCDFEIQFPKTKTCEPQYLPLEQSREARIDSAVLAAIIDACIVDTSAYLDRLEDYIDPSEHPRQYATAYARRRRREKKQGVKSRARPRLREMLARAVKAQAVILAACTGRRPSAICSTRVDLRTEQVEWEDETGKRNKGVMIRFREMKIRNVDEDVFCPGIYGELALKAIATAKELTAQMRRDNPQWQEHLFLINGKRSRSAQVLAPNQITEYLNGQLGSNTGLLKRFAIPIKRVRAHNFRHTRASNLWLGGLQIHEVAYDLGHMSTDMTIRHYVVGSEESRRRLQSLINHKALSGVLEDYVGGKEIVEARLGRRNVDIMRKQGRIISPTRYGYCCLPAASGPCTMTTPCYVGPAAAAGGCDHHILSPDALPALLEDQEVLKSNIDIYSGDLGFDAWISNQNNQLVVVERTIERAMNLASQAARCGTRCDGKCGGSSNR